MFTHVNETFDFDISIAETASTEIIQEIWLAFSWLTLFANPDKYQRMLTIFYLSMVQAN